MPSKQKRRLKTRRGKLGYTPSPDSARGPERLLARILLLFLEESDDALILFSNRLDVEEHGLGREVVRQLRKNPLLQLLLSGTEPSTELHCATEHQQLGDSSAPSDLQPRHQLLPATESHDATPFCQRVDRT